MRLLFLRSNKVGSLIIRMLTASRFSHVVALDSDGAFATEAVWPAVRRVRTSELVKHYTYHEIADIPLHDEGKAAEFLRLQLGKRYDWRALFGFWRRNRDWGRPQEWFCSELVAAAVNAGGGSVPMFRKSERVTPQMLWLVSKPEE